MAFEFHLPDIGEGLAEATIVRWLVDVGDRVELDEPLVEIETDKAVVEIPAPRQGVVLHHGAPEGAIISVDELLVVIGEPDEQWAPSPAAPRPAATGEAAPIVGTLDEADTVTSDAAPQALPRVRKLAAELGVDLASVAGSGPGGRITEEDVRAAVGVDERGPTERVRLSSTRRAIADHMSRSWREIPHVTTYEEADATRLLEMRRDHGERLGRPVPLEASLIKAVIPVLREYPQFNASLEGDEVVLKRYFDIGFAVDTEEGLLVAVVRGADALGVGEIADEVIRLAEGARSRTITMDELSGSTFTISNIGAVGGRYGTPIIPYGTTAILSVGRADPRPAVREGKVTVAAEFPLSLSYDHRVIDGATGRRFLGMVVEAIERADVGEDGE